MRICRVLGLIVLLVACGIKTAEASSLDRSFFYHYFDSHGNQADINLVGSPLDASSVYITGGTLRVLSGLDVGTYGLGASGPSVTLSPHYAFLTDNLLYPGANPALDYWGLFFAGNGMEINIWGNGQPDSYSFWSHTSGGYNVAVSDGHMSGGETVSASSEGGANANVPEATPALLTVMGLVGFGAVQRKFRQLR